MTDKLGRFERALEGGGLTPGSEPCPTCGATPHQRGIIVYACPEPPAVCPTCGRVPSMTLPDNGRDDRQGVVR